MSIECFKINGLEASRSRCDKTDVLAEEGLENASVTTCMRRYMRDWLENASHKGRSGRLCKILSHTPILLIERRAF